MASCNRRPPLVYTAVTLSRPSKPRHRTWSSAFSTRPAYRDQGLGQRLEGAAHRAVLSPHEDLQLRGAGLPVPPQLLVAGGALRRRALQLLQQYLRQNPLFIHPVQGSIAAYHMTLACSFPPMSSA